MENNLVLAQGNMRLELAPEIGGAISSLTFQGKDILRPATARAVHPLETSSFALVPYANRIAHGFFRFEGQQMQLPCNHEDDPHALHGHAWLKPWRVAEIAPDRAKLAFVHARDEWPWSYAAEQVLALDRDAVRVTLSFTNNDASAMPFSLGFHPYFPKAARTRLTAQVDSVWLSDDTNIPTCKAAPSHFLDLAGGARLAEAPFIDHCFAGLHGKVSIDLPEQGLTLTMSTSEDLNFLHLYVPRGEPFFCCEPVSAMPDALNRPEPREETGLRTLAPGETFTVWMNLEARARPA